MKALSLPVLGHKIAFSTFVQIVGKVFQLVIAAATLKIISNYLNQGDYGVYAAISEYALFFSVVANLGIFGNTVREMSKAPHDGKIFINALLLRVFTAGVFFVSAAFYLIAVGADTVFLVGTVIFCGALFFDYITSVCDGMLQANYLMGRAMIALVIGRVLNLAVVVALTQSFFPVAVTTNIPFLFLAILSGSVVTAALSIIFVLQQMTWRFEIDRAFMVNLFKISLPFGIINILNNLYFRFLPDFFSQQAMTDEQFATFNVSFRIAQVMSLFSTFLMFSVLPGFKRYLEDKDWNKARVIYKKVWVTLLGCGFLLVTVGSILAPFALEFLTHKKYFLPEFWFILPMMLLLAAISYGYDLVLITLFAMEEDLWFLKREGIALLLAGLIFYASFSIESIPLKTAIIILGALVGESYMVLCGLSRIRTIFKRY